KPLPYPQPDRLVSVSEFNATQAMDDGRVSRGTLVDWRARTRTLEDMAAFSSGGEALWTIGDRLQVVRVAAATPAMARVLSVQPILGRWGDGGAPAPGAPPQLFISYRLRQLPFDGAPDLVRRPV